MLNNNMRSQHNWNKLHNQTEQQTEQKGKQQSKLPQVSNVIQNILDSSLDVLTNQLLSCTCTFLFFKSSSISSVLLILKENVLDPRAFVLAELFLTKHTHQTLLRSS